MCSFCFKLGFYLLNADDCGYNLIFCLTCTRVSIGLFCSTPAVAIARALPRKIAMQMLLTAEPITAQGTNVLFSTKK